MQRPYITLAPDERVKLDTIEIWEFVNSRGGRGMMQPHPMHMHGE
ncbi:MAG TPA: multicopper oxidase domain-containing protein [Caldilineae bacterium]|nr:multicopper oxidase domain-containing protein [Caldilineae bacterium]